MDDEEERRPAIGLGDAVHQVSGLLAVGQNRRAKEIALGLLAGDPENPRAHYVLSEVLVATGETEAALLAVEQAVRLSPDDPLAHYGRARCLFLLGRFAAAERSAVEAIRLEPDDADTHLLYARLLHVCDREKDALGRVEDALALEPDSAAAHELRSALLLHLKPRDWSVSEAAARRALALDPDSADAHAVLGAVHLRAHDVTRAEERFRSALMLEPGHAFARRGLAETVMARSWLYAPFLRYAVWMEQAGVGTQVAVVAGAWALNGALQAWLRGQPSLAFLQGPVGWTYLALCAYTWFARPITRWMLARQHPWLREVDPA